jgi:hypothetical protein
MHMRDWFHSLQKQKWLFLVLQVLGVIVAAIWYRTSHIPPPGYAVAVLAFAAALMSLQKDMVDWQAAIWMLLIGFLLVIELKAIRIDRETTTRDALSERAAQDLHFSDIRKRQDADFKKLTEGFSATLAQNEKEFSATQRALASTLKSAEITRSQTKPYARLHVDHTIFAPVPNNRLEFHVFVVNDGAETPTKVSILTRAYPRDKVDSEIKAIFESDWKTQAKAAPGEMSPHEIFQMQDTVSELTGDEAAAVAEGKKVVVYITRLAYSDSAGRWFSDQCSVAVARGGRPHLCSFLNTQRYAAPPEN